MDRAELLHLGPVSVDLSAHVVRTPEGETALSPLEADFLAYLAAHRGETVPRARLLDEVWGYHQRSVSRAVDYAVLRLRRKIEIDPTEPVWLVSVRGAGYRLEPGPSVEPSAAPGPDLVGRADELAALAERTRDQALITLHGPPGVGKTRLCHEHLARVPADQQAFVRLRGARGAHDVHEAVASALHAELPPDEEPIAWLARVIAHRAAAPFHLALDNVEHLLEPVAELVQRVLHHAGARPLVVLVTSRRPLGLDAEQAMLVPPLSAGPAVDLLVARARQVRWSFAPQPGDRERLAALATRQLDGLPLALELAASRLALFGVDRLAEQLTDRFTVLTGDRGDAGWSSLEAALAWSWEALDTDRQAALSACALFGESFDVAAAEHVIGDGAAEHLAGLVDDALVVVEGEAPRLRLLASIRDFVLRRSPPSERAGQRFRAWYAERVAPLVDDLPGSRRAAALTVLQREAANLGEALQGAGPDEAAPLAVALAELALAVGRTHRTLPMLEGVLARLPDDHPGVDQLRITIAACLSASGRFDEVVEVLQPTLEGPRQATALGLLVGALDHLGRAEEGRQAARRALGGSTDPIGRGRVLHALAHLEIGRGSVDEGRRIAEQGLELGHATDQPLLQLACLHVLANVALLRDAPDEASRLLDEALGLAHAHDIESFRDALLHLRVHCLLDLGRAAEAARWADEVSELALRSGPSVLAYQASLLATVAHLEAGDLDAADRALDAVADHPARSVVLGMLPLRRSMVALARGERDTAEELASAAVAETEERAGAYATTRIQALLVLLGSAAARGDVARAGALLDELRAVPEGGRTRRLAAFGRVGEALGLLAREVRLRREAEELAAMRQEVLGTLRDAHPAARRMWRLTGDGQDVG